MFALLPSAESFGHADRLLPELTSFGYLDVQLR